MNKRVNSEYLYTFLGVDHMLLGLIEAGETKFIVTVGNEQMDILETVTVSTTTPEETMQ
jgi:hypothetical protein